MTEPTSSNALPAEIAKFDALAAEWWNPAGPMRPLHAMNPARVAWIDAHLAAAGHRTCSLLDVGCGAGLAAEALARAGHNVLGIDAAPAPIAAARAHAPPGLRLAYRQAQAETLIAEGHSFEAITALEVIEHVPDPAAFIADLAALLRPGGMLFVSTLNRTTRALLVAKFGAEYVLRLLPRGTHDWARFVPPAELGQHCRQAGLTLTDLTGLTPTPTGHWRAAGPPTINYIACAIATQ